MPQLSKKNFVKSQRAQDTFKPPLLTKENIEKVLGDSKTPNSSNKPSSKTSSISSKSKKNTIRKVVSIQLSFEEPNSQSSYSDISYRMNEPAVKDAYLHFVKNLSQATMNDTICSTPLVDKYDDSEDIFTPSEKLVQDDEIKVLSQDEKEKASGDSGFPLSQEMLNSQEVKEKYLDFMNNMMETDEFNFMKNFKEPAKKKTRKSISVSHSEGSEKSLIKKQNNIEKEPTKKKPKQIKEPVKKLVSKKQEGSKSKSVFKEPRRKKDKKVKQNIINKINKNASKENDESVEDDNTLSLREKMLLIQESRNVGLYCLCDTCDKARYLPDIKDPLDLPTKWYCSMNPDPDHNKCSDPEEALVDEEFLVENLFNAGSIVWAKMDGYPWWPAMVEDDPDTEDYFYFEKEDDSKPTHYHVTFFDSYDVTRAWLRPTFLQPFKINMTNPQFKIPKFNKFQSRVEFAFKQAQDAVNLSLIDRLKKYSFIQRYTKPLLNKVVQKKKLSKRVLKPKKQGTEEILLAKKKHKVCRRILSSDSENSNISVIMNNMDWQNDNIDLNIIEKTLDF